MKINRYIPVLIILSLIILILVGPKLIGKVKFNNNKTTMVKYAEEKYSKKFRITYEQARENFFTTATINPDILNLTSDDSDAFPFEVEYESDKLKDNYVYGYMGLLIKKNIESEIYTKNPDMKYVNYCTVVNTSNDEINSLPKSLNEVIDMKNKSVEFISVIATDEKPNLDDYDWIYTVYEKLTTISDEVTMHVSFTKPQYFGEFQKRFSERYSSNYSKYEEKFYYDLAINININSNPIKSKEEFMGRFK
ncbi:hypothetical protein [Clostridium sp.]